MEAIDLVMKIWGIEEEDRGELEATLKNASPEYLGFALMSMAAAGQDEDFQKENDEWMATYLPGVRIG